MVQSQAADSSAKASSGTGRSSKKVAEPFDFKPVQFVTDSLNLQKLFAFCKNDNEGLFRYRWRVLIWPSNNVP